MRAFLSFTSVLFFIALLGCVEREYDLESLRQKRDYSLETARNVLIEYSDSAQLRVRIEGPVLKRYVYRFRVEEEFPEGVDVEFYDIRGRPHAWLHAQYGIRKPGEKVMIARDSVVLYNIEGEKIIAPELIWDEKTGELHTKRFVKIIRPPDEIIYSRGFRANQDFSEYELFAVEGDMMMEEFEQQFEE